MWIESPAGFSLSKLSMLKTNALLNPLGKVHVGTTQGAVRRVHNARCLRYIGYIRCGAVRYIGYLTLIHEARRI